MWLSKLLRKINILIEKIEVVILRIGMILLALILIVNVVARTTEGAFHFIDEIAMFLVIWITFIGISYATRKGQHIRMSAIFDICSFKVKRILIFMNSTISAVVMFYMAYISVKYVYIVYYWQQVTSAVRMPYWIVISVIPLGFFMSGVHYLRTIAKNIQIKEEVWISSEQKSEYSEELIDKE